MTNKYTRGICAWRDCEELRNADVPFKYGDETWILPFYCDKHGKLALANRLALIRRKK